MRRKVENVAEFSLFFSESCFCLEPSFPLLHFDPPTPEETRTWTYFLSNMLEINVQMPIWWKDLENLFHKQVQWKRRLRKITALRRCRITIIFDINCSPTWRTPHKLPISHTKLRLLQLLLCVRMGGTAGAGQMVARVSILFILLNISSSRSIVAAQSLNIMSWKSNVITSREGGSYHVLVGCVHKKCFELLSGF